MFKRFHRSAGARAPPHDHARRYQDLVYWDALYRESLEAGTWLAGRICVVDLKGFVFSAVFKERKVIEARAFPNFENPMPDGVSLAIVRNVPGWAMVPHSDRRDP